jgi:hypothetical protein
MGPTAGSGGLGLIVGVLEGAMGDLVGLRAFPGAADHDVVCGGRVNHRIFYQILAISLVRLRSDCILGFYMKKNLRACRFTM